MRSLLLCALCWVTPVIAAPLTLSNQGYLVDANGDGLIGPHSLTFALYDDGSATNPALWSETVTVDFTDGSYSLILGETAVIDEALLDQYPLFLGLSVDAGSEMTPRHELVSVPYAILSETSFNVDGGTVNATSIATNDLTATEISGDTVTATNVVVGDTTIDLTGISVDGTPVIDGSGNYVGTPPAPADLGCTDGQLQVWSESDGAWVCGDEQDPGYSGSAASDVTAGLIEAWSDAYAWGDHGAAGYLTSEADPVFEGSVAAAIDDSDVGRWDRAHAWGSPEDWDFVPTDPDDPVTTEISATQVASWDAAASTSETDPVFEASEASLITSGEVAGWRLLEADWSENAANWDAAYAATNSDQSYDWVEWDAAYDVFDAADLPADGSLGETEVSNWNTAYGWGDHADAGYASSASLNTANWDTAYGWGNHADAGYASSTSLNTANWDAAYAAFDVADFPADGSVGNTEVSNWNTAYGWGNHADAGYASSTSLNTANWDAAYGWGDHAVEGYLTEDGTIPRADSYAVTVRLVSEGKDIAAPTASGAGVWLDGENVWPTGRSYGLVALNRSNGALVVTEIYDIYGDDTGVETDAMADALAALGPEHIVLITTFDEPSRNRFATAGGVNLLRDEILRCGGSQLFTSQQIQHRGAYMLAGICGSGAGTGIELVAGDRAKDPDARIETSFVIRDGYLPATKSPVATTVELLDRDDPRITYEGTWESEPGGWGHNAFSGSGYYTTCTETSDCSSDEITLTLNANRHRTVMLSMLDWQWSRYVDVFVSVDGGTNFSHKSRIHTWRHPNGVDTTPHNATNRVVVSNLPTTQILNGQPEPVDVIVRLQATRGRLHFEGFALSTEVMPEDGETRCPDTWASSADGRICMDTTERSPATFTNALDDCRDEGARVCTHMEMQQMCYSIGDETYAGSGTGWYGDHGVVITGISSFTLAGNNDDEFLIWNNASCEFNNDGAAQTRTQENAYKCCL